ncbi:hypothetical protein V1264_017955 [Littorina saxatilis]|uniref:Ig-like domain-containing protein n=1 Tax=Littorina saxatilis TaxID=31220 RepID=A0AAN9BIE8_9CAEN
MTVLLLAVVLLLCDIQESSASYTITECNEDEPLYIVGNQPTSITCKGLRQTHNMYWSITELCGDCKETRVGLCAACRGSSPCPHNCSDVNADYIISRTKTESMLRFVDNLTAKDGATVKCSRLNNQTQASCTVNVIKAYQLPDCNNNTLEVVDNGKTMIGCTNIDPSHDMYWSIIYPDDVEKTVAECDSCLPDDACPDCTRKYDGYVADRNVSVSILQFDSGSDNSKDGATVRCGKLGWGTVEVDCKIQVFNYRLPQCRSGQLDLSEVPPWTSIVCEDLRYDHNMKWTVTDKHNDVIEAASCLNKNKTYNCTAKDGFTATRENESTSELKITKNIREQADNTLACLRGDNAAAVKCLLRVVHPGELENPSVSIDGHFTVSGHVDISKVFASDSNVTCQWYYTQRDHPQLVSSTKLGLLLFTDNNDLHYQRGVCNMTMQLNTSESVYVFTVVVQPGHGPVSAGTVNIRKPGYPQLQTSTCPKYLAEGSDLNCSCHHPASQQVSPAASIYWENRTDTAVLEVAHLSRELNGTEYVCSSVWAKGLTGEIRSSVAYTLLVACEYNGWYY